MLTARTTAGIEAYADDWRRRHGIEIVALAQDLSLPGGAQALFEQVQARGLRIDALVNNAGIGVFGEFAETDLDAELGMLRLNIEAPTVLAKRFLPGLLERGGRILNIASVAAFPPGPFLAAYYGSKAYLRAWSEGIAEENWKGAASRLPCSARGRCARGSPSAPRPGAPPCSAARTCRTAIRSVAPPGRPACRAGGWWCMASPASCWCS